MPHASLLASSGCWQSLASLRLVDASPQSLLHLLIAFLSMSLDSSVSIPLLIRTPVLDLGPILNPVCHLKILNFTTSTKILFPNKFSLTGTGV